MTSNQRPLYGFEERLLADLKEHIESRATVDTAVPGRGGEVRPACRARRGWLAPGWRLAGAFGLVLLVTAGVLAVQVVGVANHPPVTASAAEILHGAAHAAAQQPELTARPDQFVFIEFLTYARKNPDSGPYETYRVQRWVAVGESTQWQQRSRPESEPDGWRDHPKPPPDDRFPEYFKKPAGYVTDLPTDPDRMLRYLQERPLEGEFPAGADREALMNAPTKPFTDAAWLLDGYVPPRSLGAMFEAMAKVPGARVLREEVADAAGRRGVALRMPGVIGGSTDLIFDRETFAFLGTRDLLIRDGKETLWTSNARMRVAIVDRPGQLP